jgi:Ion channel
VDIRFTREQRPLAAATQFWKTDRGLSLFSALLLIAIFVLPPLVPPNVNRSLAMDIVSSLLLISGVRALSERKLTKWVLTPVAIVTIAIHLASWLVPIDRAIVEIASFVSLILLFLVVLGQTLRSGAVNIHRIQGAVAAYLLLGVIWANAYFLVELFHPGSFSGSVSIEGGARSWLYFSFVTLTTVGYGDVLPIHPVARSLAIGEAAAGPLYLAILLARLVSLAVVPGEGREPN